MLCIGKVHRLHYSSLYVNSPKHVNSRVDFTVFVLLICWDHNGYTGVNLKTSG